MNSRSTMLEIATTNYEKDIDLISSAMSSLQSLCDVTDGFLISEPMHRFGWTFFRILLKNNLWSAMPLKLDQQIQTSKGKKYEEKLVSFMTVFFEQNSAKVKVKFIEV
ncbi:MAG TPA: hypothetical protein VJ792_02500 [Candidatus Nitrosotalea sp.]|nr:hypothetical protein [Candidatus Nitrosotalea sp.]